MRWSLSVCFAATLIVNAAAGELRLIVVPANVNILPGKPLSIDVYLYNDGKQSVTVPPLRFTSAKWTLNDPVGQRLSRGGETRLVSDHGTPDVRLQAGRVLHETMELDINAERGDLVKVECWLQSKTALRSQPFLLYCDNAVNN